MERSNVDCKWEERLVDRRAVKKGIDSKWARKDGQGGRGDNRKDEGDKVVRNCQGPREIFFLEKSSPLIISQTMLINISEDINSGYCVILASAARGECEDRSSYRWQAGNRELHMPRIPIAMEHLHSNQHTRHYQHVFIQTLRVGKRTILTALQCSPLLNIHRSL